MMWSGLMNRVVAAFKRRPRKPTPRRVVSLEDRTLPAAVNVTLATNAAGRSDITIAGSAVADEILFSIAWVGDDTYQVRVNALPGSTTTFRVNGASPVDSFMFRPRDRVTLQLAGGSDVVNIATSLPNVVIQDGNAAGETNTYTFMGGTYSSVVADFDQGRNTVELRSLTGNPLNVAGDLNVTFRRTVSGQVRGGFEDSQFRIGGLVRVTSLGTNSQDRVSFGGMTGTGRLERGLNLDLGSGNDEVEVYGPVTVLGQCRIETGTGNDQVILFGGLTDQFATVNPPQFFTSVDIRTGDGSDLVALGAVNNQTRTVFSQPVTVDTGGARDAVSIQLAEFRSRLDVNTGANPSSEPEFLRFDRSEVFRATQIRMGGWGVVAITGFGLLPARFRAGLIITMGTGMVLIGEVDPGSRVIFDSLVWIFGLNRSQPVSVRIQSSPGVVILNRRRLLTENAVVTG